MCTSKNLKIRTMKCGTLQKRYLAAYRENLDPSTISVSVNLEWPSAFCH